MGVNIFDSVIILAQIKHTLRGARKVYKSTQILYRFAYKVQLSSRQ